MHSIDHRLYTGLTRMRNAYDALTRSAAMDKYNTSKMLLDAEWQAELEPVMRDLYWHPFRNGITEAPDSERDLKRWLKNRFRDAAIIAALFLLLQRYHKKAANLGGQMALDVLGIDGTFNLTRDEYLQEMNDRADMLTTQGSEQSLIDTTIDDLTQAVTAARIAEIGVLSFLGAYITQRAAQRTVLIERYERPWAVAQAQDWAYQNNDVRYKMYDVFGVGCIKICAPWHGQVFTTSQYVTLIPQHGGCDCIWSPVQYDGQTVGMPPVTVSVPGLPPWQPPATPWTGGDPIQTVQAPSRPRYLPNRNSVNVALGNSEQYVRDAMQRLNVTRDELMQGAEQSLHGLLSNGRMAVQYPSQRIDALLNDGRFKTVFESGSSNAHAQTLQFRRDVEKFGMGIPKNAPDAIRPVYGYLHVGTEAEGMVSHYGDLTIFLKEDTRNRATFTATDSTFPLQQKEAVASGFGQVNRAAWQPQAGALYEYGRNGNLSTLLREIDYIETQVQNGVSLNDVTAVLDRNGVLTAAQRASLQQKGIAIWHDVP